jgi:hypothetical protein
MLQRWQRFLRRGLAALTFLLVLALLAGTVALRGSLDRDAAFHGFHFRSLTWQFPVNNKDTLLRKVFYINKFPISKT